MSPFWKLFVRPLSTLTGSIFVWRFVTMASQENTAAEVESTVARIAEKKEEWAQIPIAQKLAVLLQVNPLRIP